MEHAVYPGLVGGWAPDFSDGVRVLLLGRFGLWHGVAPVWLAPGSQRLLAYVALAGRGVRRDLAAGALWPSGALRADALDVALGAGVGVDLHDAQVLARRLLADAGAVAPDAAAAAIAGLSVELLPGWYEDWVLLEAENWRQLRLHALEAVAGVLATAGRFGEAVAAAQAAVCADPLRESPRAALVAVHLSEGNQSEALREFERYRRRLGAALGLEPTARLRALLPGQ